MINFFSAIALISILPFSVAFADEESVPIIPPLEISPVSKRVSLNPEQKKSGTIEIKNYGNERLKVKVYASPFSNADGTRNFEKDNYYTKLSHWIKIKDDSGVYQKSAKYTVEPKKSKTISYKITVPKDAPAGGQYATIFVETIADKKEGEDLETTTRAGMLIYATISGEIRREASVTNVYSNNFVTSENLKVGYTVENKGNIDFQTSTTLQISSIFGNQIYSDTQLHTILPEESQEIKLEWNDSPGFGFYILHYKIRALEKIIEKNELILVASPFIIILFITAIIVLILTIIYRVKLHSHKKAH